MLVGDVRRARPPSGVSWKLSGGSQWLVRTDEELEVVPRLSRHLTEATLDRVR